MDGQRRTGTGRPLQPEDPERVGAYTILGRIGEGGMGAVYLGRGPDGRQVAIKVVRPELAQDAGFVARFEDEVANAQRVASFCTAQVLDHGQSDGRAYMVTEYIDGLSLKDYVQENGELSPGMLQGVAIGVAAALVAIHAAGLIHRDLKPANVMLSFSGPRVIDFGIARALDVASGLTMTGQLVGSPGWMAPERILQQEVTTAVDVFSWGCLVAFAQSGANPFGTGDFSVISARLVHGEPKVGPLPAPLDRLVRAALDKDPRNRPTARELLLTMVGAESSEAAVLSTLTAWPQSPIPLTPQSGPPAGSGGSAQDRPGEPGPPPGWALMSGDRSQDQPGKAGGQPRGQSGGQPLGQSSGQSSAPQGNGAPAAYRSERGSGSGRPPAGGPPAGAGYTVAAGPSVAPERTAPAGPRPGPGQTVAAGPQGGAGAWGGAGAPERTHPAGSGGFGGQGGPDQGRGSGRGGTKPIGPQGNAASAVESPTMPGRQEARPPTGSPPFPPGPVHGGRQGRGKVVLAAAAVLVLGAAAVSGWLILKPTGDDGHHPANTKKAAATGPAPLSKDKLVVRIDRQSGWPNDCHGSIGILDSVKHTATKVFNDNDKCDILPRLSPDRKQIAFTRELGGDDNQLWLMNADGTGLKLITSDIWGHSRVAWSHDGKKIAFLLKSPTGSHVRQVAVITLANPQKPQPLTNDSDLKDDPAWCGDRIAFWKKPLQGGTQQIYTIDASSGGSAIQVTHAGHDVNDPSFSPDCKTMAFTDQPGGDARHIWLTAADGSWKPHQLTSNATRDMDAAYSPDGTWIAVARGATENQSIWAIHPDGTGEKRISPPGGIAHPDWY